jgi:hypothetical protein
MYGESRAIIITLLMYMENSLKRAVFLRKSVYFMEFPANIFERQCRRL